MGEITDRMVFRGEGRGYQSSTECKEGASEGEGGGVGYEYDRA